MNWSIRNRGRSGRGGLCADVAKVGGQVGGLNESAIVGAVLGLVVGGANGHLITKSVRLRKSGWRRNKHGGNDDPEESTGVVGWGRS